MYNETLNHQSQQSILYYLLYFCEILVLFYHTLPSSTIPALSLFDDQKPQSWYLANSEDQDKMPNAAFHQDLHCLPRQNQPSEKDL